jgi:hypothetical protein
MVTCCKYLKGKQMDEMQAFKLVSEACKVYKGTAKDHQMLGQALNIIGTRMFDVPKPKTVESKEVEGQ